MDTSSRIGDANAQVVLVVKGGRDHRYDRLRSGEEVPREFFYGYFDLMEAGVPTAFMSSAGSNPGVAGLLADKAERAFAYLTALGIRPLSTLLARNQLQGADVVISYTDGFSLSMGLGLGQLANRPVLLGGFHGLTDIEEREEIRGAGLVRRLIARSLRGLDHTFFFGEADREEAIRRYELSRELTSVIPFGVDTEFWRPEPTVPVRNVAVAIGQDMNRDFDLLAAAPGRNPTHIVTRRAVNVPSGASHVTVATGDFFGSNSMSDQELRTLYNMASVVVVPLKDVNQPTGYSVTLQAMSCGRPVILSRIRGLWSPDLLKDGENCLLIPPSDRDALGRAITLILNDRELATRLGAAARSTAERHFSLRAIGDGTVALARLGLEIARRRRNSRAA
jgi:hypothetical protein